MKIKHVKCVAMLLPALLLGLAGSAFAVDGITLIKQTPTTVFPIVISTSGSYRLSSDLTVASTTVDAIDIKVDNVTLDLNGFSIAGPGSGFGIGVGGPAPNNVTVTNGVVTAMGLFGIQLGEHAHVEGIRAISNLSDGLFGGDFSRFIGNVAKGNGGDGIGCINDCLVSGSAADANGGDGVSINAGGTVIGNSASGNGGDGIDTGVKSGYGKNVMENNAFLCANGPISMGDNVCNGVLQ